MIFEPEAIPPKTKFRVIGVVVNPAFQLCRCYTERLYKSLPAEYEEPDIRPVLGVEWEEFLTKMRRKIGGEKLWRLRKAVAVFVDNEFLGDDDDLLEYISGKYRMAIVQDYYKVGNRELIKHLQKQSELGRNFVYFVISIDKKMIGSLLFVLYADLVPHISEIFMRRCDRYRGGYMGALIHRIAKPSWIQIDGSKLKSRHLSCENYVIHHDRRGVLSMCNNGKHIDNSTHFYVTLDPAPWMDYKYVAFGQLIQGEDTLRAIENVPTSYEAPQKKIQIIKAGEFTFYPKPDPKEMANIEKHLATVDFTTGLHKDLRDPRDTDSALSVRKYEKGLYCAPTDMQSYLPFLHLPDYLIYKYLVERKTEEAEEEGWYREDYVQDEEIEFEGLQKSRHIDTSLIEKGITSDVTSSFYSSSATGIAREIVQELVERSENIAETKEEAQRVTFSE